MLFNLGEGFFLLLDVLVKYIYDFIKHVFAQVTETFKINTVYFMLLYAISSYGKPFGWL